MDFVILLVTLSTSTASFTSVMSPSGSSTMIPTLGEEGYHANSSGMAADRFVLPAIQEEPVNTTARDAINALDLATTWDFTSVSDRTASEHATTVWYHNTDSLMVNWSAELVSWTMPKQLWVTVLCILCLELVITVGTNALLVATIVHSPSLRTPPNALLVSICINNLLLGASMVLSAVDLVTSGGAVHGRQAVHTRILGDLQMFLVVTCLIQYWCIFSAIGYYRTKTLRRPSMSQMNRRKIIRCTTVSGWVCSSMISLFWCLFTRPVHSSFSWDPFQASSAVVNAGEYAPINFRQSVILFFMLLLFLVGIVVIGLSYHLIFKTLYVARPLCHNRVSPWARASSFSSEENDLTFGGRRSYRPVDLSWTKSPFTLTSGIIGENVMVHFQKHTQMVSFDMFALENPMRAQRLHERHHQPLGVTVSNTSVSSRSSRCLDFSDISPAGELQRVSHYKNSCALQNYSLRRDRVSLSSASKNSLVMLGTYFTFSLPMALCSLPGVLAVSTVADLSVPLLICRLVFYLNAPAYPVWYLLFSRRVRKCLQKLIERVLVYMNIKK